MMRTATSPRFATRSFARLFGVLVTRVSSPATGWRSSNEEPDVLTDDDLLRVLAAITVTAPVRSDEVTPSTNATAFAMAEAGEPEWTIVAAGHQTEGRGRLGRVWSDVPDGALLVSFVLRPRLPPARTGLLSLLAGATMAEAIRATTARRVTCKWPNDLLLHDAKVGGILLESSVVGDVVRFVVVGVGVNLAPPSEQTGAGGIGAVGLGELLEAFLTRFARVYTAADIPLPQQVRNAWLPLSATIGQLVRAETTDGREIAGRAVGIDEFGGLVLSTDAGEARVSFGEVEHLGVG
jgi:BirA family transcriptional regulator, biotin operon repressor / biotin---[acetyl-CoA-carboxylase] ligase